MARTRQDKRMDTRSARLENFKGQRREPWWRPISKGLAIGYRKGSKGGTWIARHYSQEHGRRYQSIGTADDLVDADGVHVLNFDQAQEKARKWFTNLAKQDSGGAVQIGPFSVADAMDAYVAFLESEGRSEDSIADTRYRDRAFIRPKLGAMEVRSLTADLLRKWRDGVAKAAPRLRTKPGEKQKYREVGSGESARRARRASANRTWTTLRAALNHAFQTDKIDSDKAWRKVKPFKSVDAVRVRYLSIAEAKRLINACDPEFRPLVQAALLTGGRYGQIIQLTVGDFNADAGTLTMRTRKGDGSVKVHHVHLTAEGARFFKVECAQRGGAKDLIFKKADGSQWKKSHQARPIEEASVRAKIDPPSNFHVTRHTWASHAVMNGTPLLVVAGNLGHADTRMVEKHYGHLAPGYRQDEIRKGAPKFGIKPKANNVTSLDEHRTKGVS
jgi:integrase